MRRLTIQEMHRLANAKNGKCLSTVYKGNWHPLEWECREGHRWFALPSSVKQGHWCKLCAAERRAHSIGMMQQLAVQHFGKCLSTAYKNSQSPLEWECAKGHRWSGKPNTIQRGSWCRKCAGLERKTILEMKTLALAKGGCCLSPEYINAMTKLQWECGRGHKWWTKPNSIQQGRWCPICAGKQKKSVEEMRRLAASRGGKFLSEQYIKSQVPHLWECREGHQWKARPANIIQGQWCPKCGWKTKALTDADMIKLAAARGGRFLSEHYLAYETKLEWECAEGHRWFATPRNIIVGGTWCPECSKGLSERIVRLHFEQIFHERFPTQKPRWLINSRGNRMELDGYCAELGVAFEYHGPQHFRVNAHFHRGADTLAQRMADDERKRTLCKAHGVKLIEIPHQVKAGQMKEHIISECARLGVRLFHGADNIGIDVRAAYLRRNLERMQEYASAKGGRCLSEAYVDAHTHLQWECASGHRWLAKPNSIQQGLWCKQCVQEERQQARKLDLGKISRTRGGRLISSNYENSYTKLEWECEHGHRWRAVPAEVKRGSWCPQCARAIRSKYSR